MNILLTSARTNLDIALDPETPCQKAGPILEVVRAQALVALAELQQTANEIALASLLHQLHGIQPKSSVEDELIKAVHG